MNELFREKKNALLGLAGGTIAVCFLIWYSLIRPEQATITRKRELTQQVQSKIEVARKNAQLVDEMEAELEQNQEKLANFEDRMAEGDVYLWIVNKLLKYTEPYGIAFHEIDAPQEGELDVFPKVPYQAARFGVGGTATYFGFGEFLAEFENNFPSMRIRRLELEPASGSSSTNDEPRIAFKMEFTMLIRGPENRTPREDKSEPKD